MSFPILQMENSFDIEACGEYLTYTLEQEYFDCENCDGDYDSNLFSFSVNAEA